LGQPRNAEKYFRQGLAVEPMLVTYIGLAKVYVKLDQPLAALDICQKGLEKFPGDVTLLTEMGRYYATLTIDMVTFAFANGQ